MNQSSDFSTNLSSYVTWSKQNSLSTLPIKSSEGSHYILDDGSFLDDFISTSFQVSFGHSEQKIIKPIEAWLKQLPIAPPKANYTFKEKQTQRLLEYLKLPDGKIFYTVSGAESVENALKMARQISGRKIILARQKSYHGASLGALSVTGDWRNKSHATVEEWTVRIPEPTEQDAIEKTRQIIEKIGPKNIAGFCLETISGTNGVIIASEDWWKGIQNLCKEFDLYLIIDEVLTGFRRTGANFAFHHYNLEPDFVVMSKAISGGYIPFGAVYTSPAVAKYYENEVLSCGLTNYAHPLGLAAMSGVLDLLNDQSFISDVNRKELEFAGLLEDLRSNPLVQEIRCRGLLAAVETKAGFVLDKVSQEFLKVGLHLYAKGNQIILAPPLTMNSETLKSGFLKIQKILDALTKAGTK